MSALLPDCAAAMRALYDRVGPVWGRDGGAGRLEMLEALEPYLAAGLSSEIVYTLDIAYGTDRRQVLDIYRPRQAPAAMPVVVFMHGGGYVRGDKDATPHVYANVTNWFAKQGYVAINLEYRLAPLAAYPGGAQDLGACVAWVLHNIAGYGGDPERIFIVGHSAGGTHVAHFALDPALRDQGRDRVLAAAIVSGRLRADVLSANPNAAGVRAYFGDDESVYERLSPVNMVSPDAMPLFVAIAEYENPLLDCYGAEFFHRLLACGHRANQFMSMPHHNHLSIMAHFNTGEDLLGRQICAFFERHGAALRA